MLEYPQRSPLIVAEAIKDIIKDKTVCDVGCGEGDLMKEFAKYAKNVIGIEKNPDRLKVAVSNGFNVRGGDARIRLPEADVYYVWMGRIFMTEVTPLIENKMIVFGRSNDTEPDETPYATSIDETRDITFQEGKYSGIFHLYIHYPI